MLFGTAKRLNLHGRKLMLVYQNQPINFVSEYKYLGVVIDTNLNFTTNFDKSYKSASSRLRLLQRLRPYLTIEAAQKVYLMMITPLITYSSTHRNPLTDTQIKQLNSLDQRAINITKCGDLPSLHNLIKRNICLLVHKCITNELDVYPFNNYFKVFEHKEDTRNNLLSVKLPRVKLEAGGRGFYFAGGSLYNTLPANLRMEKTLSKFKDALGKHYA